MVYMNKEKVIKNIRLQQRKYSILNRVIRYDLDVKKYCKWMGLRLVQPLELKDNPYKEL